MSNPIEIVNRFYDATNRKDWAACAALIDPHCEMWTPAGSGEGPEAVLSFNRMWAVAFPDYRIISVRQVASGENVASENRFTGTHSGVLSLPTGDMAATGRAVDGPYVGFFRVVDDRIVSQRVYLDRLDIMEELGLVPSK
jgi:predicted ester cyclase